VTNLTQWTDIAGNETHAGQVFCCVGALAIADALQHLDADLLSWWCVVTAQNKARGQQARP